MSTQNKIGVSSSAGKIGIVLMTYGSATTAEHVPAYFKSIYGERISPATITEFEKRYRAVGHSPLIEITKKQASLLQDTLGESFIVQAGMRHSAPSIDEAVATCKAGGAASLTGIILSPQYSSFIMKGYETAFEEAARKHGFPAGTFSIALSWPTEEHFVELLARNVSDAYAELQKKYGESVPVIFTTHSLPERVVAGDPNYLAELRKTIDAIRAFLPPSLLWRAGYQSAGHTPEAWLKPDLVDIIRELKKDGASAVLIVPFQFLSDHLEILYDLDIAACRECTELGVDYYRTTLPNTDPLFISALAAIVHKTSSITEGA